MKEKVLEVKKREPMTKGELNRLRKTGYVPGVLYSKDLETPLTFSVFETTLNKYIYTSETHMILLKFDDGAEHNAIIKDVQFDPMTDKVIHIDFHAVKFGEVINVEVPVELTGSSVGVKEGGKIILSNHKLEIECLPREIPENLEIDITELAIGDSIFVRDLSFDGVKILNSEDTLVVAVAAPHEEEELEEEEAVFGGEETAEPEVISKGKSDEDEE